MQCPPVTSEEATREPFPKEHYRTKLRILVPEACIPADKQQTCEQLLLLKCSAWAGTPGHATILCPPAIDPDLV